MTRRDMDKAGTLLGGDMATGQQWHLEIISLRRQWVRCHGAGQLISGQGGAGRHILNTKRRCHRISQLISHTQHITSLHQHIILRRGDFDNAIGNVIPIGDGAVAGHGPGGGCPDDDAGPVQCLNRACLHRKTCINRDRCMVFIFDFSLGKRGLFHRRPHDRLGTTIKAAIHQDFAKLLGDFGFGFIGHCGVGRLPVPEHAKPLKFGRLHGQPMRCKIAAFLPEFSCRHGVFVFPFFTILLFDFPFDGQAMAIPAGHIIGVFAKHRLRAVDNILQNLVQRMADMQLSIGIRWAIMQHKFWRVLARLAQLFIEINLLPALQNLWFLFRQSSPHGKIRTR